MTQRAFIEFLNKIEKLKCVTRHSWTSSGRRESVAEHSWRLAVMAMLCKNEFPELDIDKVIKMCLIHDFGEALTGDIPAFFKTEAHEETEEKATEKILSMLKSPVKEEFSAEHIETYGHADKKICRVASFCGAGGDEGAIAFAKKV